MQIGFKALARPDDFGAIHLMSGACRRTAKVFSINKTETI
jgi:hypothetical protein